MKTLQIILISAVTSLLVAFSLYSPLNKEIKTAEINPINTASMSTVSTAVNQTHITEKKKIARVMILENTSKETTITIAPIEVPSDYQNYKTCLKQIPSKFDPFLKTINGMTYAEWQVYDITAKQECKKEFNQL